jgi:hypothetical protein
MPIMSEYGGNPRFCVTPEPNVSLLLYSKSLSETLSCFVYDKSPRWCWWCAFCYDIYILDCIMRLIAALELVCTRCAGTTKLGFRDSKIKP